MTGRYLVVGLGHPDRGDDGVGRAVAHAVRALGVAGVDVVEHDDPIGLLDLWPDYAHVVVVDAVRSGDPAGTVRVHDLLTASLPVASGTSSHAFDLAGTVELARSLDRLPSKLVLVGVEGASFALGEMLSPAVRAALDEAVDTVLAALTSDS